MIHFSSDPRIFFVAVLTTYSHDINNDGISYYDI